MKDAKWNVKRRRRLQDLDVCPNKSELCWRWRDHLFTKFCKSSAGNWKRSCSQTGWSLWTFQIQANGMYSSCTLTKFLLFQFTSSRFRLFFFSTTYKQVEKLKHDEKETKKLQDSLQSLQLRLAAREHICRTLQEKVRMTEVPFCSCFSFIIVMEQVVNYLKHFFSCFYFSLIWLLYNF